MTFNNELKTAILRADIRLELIDGLKDRINAPEITKEEQSMLVMEHSIQSVSWLNDLDEIDALRNEPIHKKIIKALRKK